MLAIRLPPELEERLDKLARKTGRTKTYYARAAILEYLDDLEDIHLAEKRYGALAAGRGKTISLDELERTLGLAD